jgi:hypothetical protein
MNEDVEGRIAKALIDNPETSFVREAVGFVHLVADKHWTRLVFFDSKESAEAYIVHDHAESGPRNDDAYLRYEDEAPIYCHRNRVEVTG